MPISPLFSFPPGLLGYLRQKVGGTAPDKFGDVLTPVIEIGDLYGLAQQVGLPGSAAATGTVALATVPANERWAMLSFGGRLTNASVGAIANAWLVTDTGLNTIQSPLTPSRLYSTILAGDGFVAQIAFPQRWILEPGSRLGVTLAVPSTFPSNWLIEGSVRYLALPI